MTDIFIIEDGRRRYLTARNCAVVERLAFEPAILSFTPTVQQMLRLRLIRHTRPKHRTVTLTGRGLRVARRLASEGFRFRLGEDD